MNWYSFGSGLPLVLRSRSLLFNKKRRLTSKMRETKISSNKMKEGEL